MKGKDPNRFWHVKKLAHILSNYGYFVLHRGNVLVAINDNSVYILDFGVNKMILNEPKKLKIYKVKYVNDDAYKSFIAKLVFYKNYIGGGEIEQVFPFGGEIEVAQ